MQQIKLELIKKALEDKLATNIVTLDVEEKTPFFSYYVICTVKNIRQANACIEQIKENLEKSNIEYDDKKGSHETPWSILDLGDILVHIFTEEERQRVSLEELLNLGK